MQRKYKVLQYAKHLLRIFRKILYIKVRSLVLDVSQRLDRQTLTAILRTPATAKY